MAFFAMHSDESGFMHKCRIASADFYPGKKANKTNAKGKTQCNNAEESMLPYCRLPA
jgi:hypothetical protein